MLDSTRGVLYPRRLPEFHRLPAPDGVADLVSWFWIPEWDVEPGRTSRQEIVGYPALNLVVERGAVVLSGATTMASHRDLRGRGWAVGAVLRPAAVPALTDTPSELVDGEIRLDADDLQAAVAASMDASTASSADERRGHAVRAFSSWLRRRVGDISEPGRQANAMADVLQGPDPARTPEEAAARLAVSVRTLQRMTHRYVGLSPAAMIRRRRLQDAAERLRTEPGQDLAALAADLGYADHAHLTRDFASVLGIAPRVYRADAAGSVTGD